MGGAGMGLGPLRPFRTCAKAQGEPHMGRPITTHAVMSSCRRSSEPEREAPDDAMAVDVRLVRETSVCGELEPGKEDVAILAVDAEPGLDQEGKPSSHLPAELHDRVV